MMLILSIVQPSKPSFNTATAMPTFGGGGGSKAMNFNDDEITDEDVIEKPPALKDLDMEMQKSTAPAKPAFGGGGRITNRMTDDEFDF